MKSTKQNWNGSLITSCRSQAVQYQGILSEAQPVFTGVPQGRQHLTPMTLLIYTSARSDIDTIPKNLSERRKQFIPLRFEESELTINLEKGKTESMLFET